MQGSLTFNLSLSQPLPGTLLLTPVTTQPCMVGRKNGIIGAGTRGILHSDMIDTVSDKTPVLCMSDRGMYRQALGTALRFLRVNRETGRLDTWTALGRACLSGPAHVYILPIPHREA